ncbi:MAG: hypothetical protein GY842_07900 [bacterium]|nr:hypothetical protein [bacterium]
MARAKRKKTSGSYWPQWWSSKDQAAKRASLVMALQVLAVAGLAVGATYALATLEARVHAAQRFADSPVVELADVPPGLEETIAAKVAPFERARGYDPEICLKIGRALEADPWVRRVRSVSRLSDLRVVVECDYREPAVLIQIGNIFYVADNEAVRLPGTYGYEQTLPLIQGVGSEPPAPGERWNAPDLDAGMALIHLISRETFAHQITGVQVHNFGGRLSPRESHLVLATDRSGSLIYWGSAPGAEVEENSPAQKMAILRDNYARLGRVDANCGPIDISAYPDRFIVPR